MQNHAKLQMIWKWYYAQRVSFVWMKELEIRRKLSQFLFLLKRTNWKVAEMWICKRSWFPHTILGTYHFHAHHTGFLKYNLHILVQNLGIEPSLHISLGSQKFLRIDVFLCLSNDWWKWLDKHQSIGMSLKGRSCIGTQIAPVGSGSTYPQW